MLFDVGGVAGGVMAGHLSDRSGASAIVSMAFTMCSIPVLWMYRTFGHRCGLSTCTGIVPAELAHSACIEGGSRGLHGARVHSKASTRPEAHMRLPFAAPAKKRAGRSGGAIKGTLLLVGHTYEGCAPRCPYFCPLMTTPMHTNGNACAYH